MNAKVNKTKFQKPIPMSILLNGKKYFFIVIEVLT